METRVRDDEARRVDREALDPQEIEVEGSRTPWLGAHAPEARFDRLQAIEQIERRALVEDARCRIEELRLRRAPDGCGRVDARRLLDAHEARELAHRRAHRRQPIAEVRADADDPAHRQRPRTAVKDSTAGASTGWSGCPCSRR